MWVKGSGCDLATMEREHFTPLRLEEMLPLFERDEMSDEDMVAHLARCQTDPAAPRASIETLLHAFVPADHVHHTHPDAINVLAGTRDGERLVRECFGDEAAWIPYIRPGFTLAKQVGEAVRNDPVAEARRARQARPRRVGRHRRGGVPPHARRHQPRGRLRQRADERRRRGSAASRTAPASTRTSARRCCARCCPALRGAVSSERPKVLVVDTSPRVLEFVSSRDAPELTDVGAACPDHLVHTKRVPLWIPFDPSTEDAAVAVRAGPRARGGVPRRRTAPTSSATATSRPSRPTPTRASCSSSTSGWSASRRRRKNARLSRDLYHRAIEVMAGAHALGGFTSLDEGESFAVEYWPLELYKLSLAPPPGELQGTVALVTGAAGGIGRAVVDALSSAGACVVALRPRRRGRGRGGRGRSATRARPSPAT